MIALNGTVKFKSRKIPIFWTGEIAQHVADNYYNDNDLHPYQHTEIQQMLAACRIFRKTVGIFKIGDNQAVAIPFKLVSNFAVIKTAFIIGGNMENTTSSNKVSGNEDFFIHPGVQAMVDEGHYPDAVDFQKFLNKLFTGNTKKKTRKKKSTKK